ncbi:RDD family protein [Bacillus sp. 1P06AnD]|uniref:RDD family protein n=1 Tax=Bacillus sp. 1P06AnD TaxID=3132208 RepID=UPI0039A14EC4
MHNTVGFWKRLLAMILDGVIITLPLTIISYLFTGDWDESDLASFIDFLISFILPIVWFGYTVGKRIVGIRIARVDGRKVGIGTMLLRLVVSSLVYILTFGIGFIISAFMVGLRKDHRAIHDFIAGTYVTDDLPGKRI